MNDHVNDKRLLDFCQRLIQTRSYSGEESAVALMLNDEAKRLGFDDAWIDDYGNAICKLEGTASGERKNILLDGHMDTVPANENNWSYPPFKGVIENGRLYGRGASDMKCSLGAMLYAVARLVPEKDKICGDVYISGTVNEEQFEGIAFGEVLRKIQPHLVIIGEASEMKLKIGQRGRTEVKLEAFGKGSHSSNPQFGKNAVYTMMDYISILRKSDVSENDFLGAGISELTDIASEPYPGASVLPYYCTATIDRRLLCGETRKSVLSAYHDVLNKLKKDDPNAEMKISIAHGREKTYTGEIIESDRFFPAWMLPEDELSVQTVAGSIETLGLPVEIAGYSFCTNGSMSAGEMKIPTLGFGPGEEALAHIDDEYVRIDELIDACRVYTQIIRDWLKPQC